jgi:hypothetical protein
MDFSPDAGERWQPGERLAGQDFRLWQRPPTSERIPRGPLSDRFLP